MNAIAERIQRAPARRNQITKPSRLIAVETRPGSPIDVRHADDVEPDFRQLHGRHLIRSEWGQNHPTYPRIVVGDVLDVDFDCKRIDCEGLFLVTGAMKAGPIDPRTGKVYRWFGARHFCWHGMLQMNPNDFPTEAARAEYVKVTPELEIEVVGYVYQVYRAIKGGGYQ
ncbi:MULTISPECIES: hypothetical protein [unclassified Variovorax]|uniref:hypothetical protein n=1 Tax=unclassified Variovorax TaxID=663243 RepID=UPI003F47C38D